MQIFNATSRERIFYRSDNSPIKVPSGLTPDGEEPRASSVELATPALIKSVYDTARDEDGNFVLGLILADGFEKEKVDSVIGHPTEGFIFQSVSQAYAVLTEGKDFSVEIADNIQVGYEIKFDALTNEINDKNATITELNGKIETLKSHEASMLEKIAELNDSIAELKTKLAATEDKLSASRKEVAEKELALNQARSVADTYRTQAEHKQTDIKVLNDTVSAANRNNAAMREGLAKANAILADLKVFYGLQEVEPGIWRIPAGVDEARNTVLLDKLVTRLKLVYADGEYLLPSEMKAANPSVLKPEKKK